MVPTEAQIAERTPVWEALSEFFLDTELQPEDYARIAKQLSVSRYSDAELDEILNFEVYPTCSANLFCIAGEWSGFDSEWLRERIVPRYNQRPFWRIYFHRRWIFARHWETVRTLVAKLRHPSPNA